MTWTWNSLHCHSVDGPGFVSGRHWPAKAGAIHAVPGFFDHPVPDDAPGLSFSHTFATPGAYRYACFHHAAIGMVGVVIVE